MKASEAHATAEQFNKTNFTPEYNSVMSQIKVAAKVGHFCIDVYKHLLSETIEELRDQGYKVTDLCDNIRNEPLYKIEW